MDQEVAEEAIENENNHSNYWSNSLLSKELLEKHGGHAFDFRGEALTFKVRLFYF